LAITIIGVLAEENSRQRSHLLRPELRFGGHDFNSQGVWALQRIRGAWLSNAIDLLLKTMKMKSEKRPVTHLFSGFRFGGVKPHIWDLRHPLFLPNRLLHRYLKFRRYSQVLSISMMHVKWNFNFGIFFMKIARILPLNYCNTDEDIKPFLWNLGIR
jgi:hypothetical protein